MKRAWKDVKDELPPKDVQCLVWVKGPIQAEGCYRLASYLRGVYSWFNTDDEEEEIDFVRYWLPLPKGSPLSEF